MSFNYYFTKVTPDTPSAEYAIKNNCCVLLSQLNDRNLINKWITKFKELGTVPIKLFVDSGAFSAWTKQKKINVDDYINFINDNEQYFEICASVDSIPGKKESNIPATYEEVCKSCQKTWDNFLYMRSKMKNVKKLLYTFHIGEPWEYLKQALDYKDEHGNISYIALGGLVGKTSAVIEKFLKDCFEIIKNSSNPNIKVHAFGMTSLKLLEKYPLYSADSITWLKQAMFGQIVFNGKTYCLSDRLMLDNDNILNKGTAIKESALKAITEKGFTLESLLESHAQRSVFNMMYYKEWSDNYSYKPNTAQKQLLF